MNVENAVTRTGPEQLKELMRPGPEGPIYMVNLLKFKDKAEYEDGRESNLSGREAYNLYGRAVSKIITSYGGKVIFVADVTFLSLGEVEELWDEVAIAMYPKRAKLVEMFMSKEWQEAAVHRTAGLKGQLNIETVGGLVS